MEGEAERKEIQNNSSGRTRERVKYIPITKSSADKQTQERQKGKEKYLQKCQRSEECKHQLDLIDSQPSTSGTSLRQNDCEKLILKCPYPNKFSKQGTGAKKKYDSALKRARREIEKLKEENQPLNSQVEKKSTKGFKENRKGEIWKSSILIRTLQHQDRK